jgi:NADPH2:quinone reductase
MKTKAMRVHRPGGPEVFSLDDIELPAPAKGEARVRLEAIGVNYIDVYQRSGLYVLPLPFVPGSEGAGVVEEVGPEVTEVKAGDRVAWASHLGSYAHHANVPAWKLVPIPDGLDATQAAAAMLQGMTAHYLVRTTFPLGAGKTALVHAAAGGVGLLLCQMGRTLGARVLGTTSTEAKAELARAAGADEVILYTQKDFAEEVKRLTDRKGVDVVYDSVGKDTFDRSLTVLRPRGMMVLYGQSSGSVPAFELGRLAQGGSLFLTRPTLGHYMLTRDELLARAADVLGDVRSGALKLRIEHTYPLAEVARAHEDLTGRKTTGKLILLV